MLDRIGAATCRVRRRTEERLRGQPGALLATRDGAICRATGDGAVWLARLQAPRDGERRFKLPAHAGARRRLAGVPRVRRAGALPAGAT